MKKTNRYFIALVPPEPLLSEINELKRFFADHYGSRAALRSPAHITLHMPFEWAAADEQELKDALLRFAERQRPFNIELNGFGCFPPRVIFIRPVPSSELEKLQAGLKKMAAMELGIFNADRLNQGFHPHVTLAFRDLKKRFFEEAFAAINSRKFDDMWTAKSIELMRHTGQEWEVAESCMFNNSVEK